MRRRQPSGVAEFWLPLTIPYYGFVFVLGFIVYLCVNPYDILPLACVDRGLFVYELSGL
jgi:hypothetical protein